MVRVNPGSFFPEHEFAQLDRNAVEQLVLGIDSDSVIQQLAMAGDLDAMALLPVSELIIKLLVEDRDEQAAKVMRLILAILNAGNSVFAGTIWQNMLFTVIPSAVVLQKFDFLDRFVENELSDPISRSGLLAVAAQICLAKQNYQRAKTYLQKAKASIAGNPMVSTFSIDELMEYTEAKLSGDTDRSLSELGCVHDHSSLVSVGSNEDFDWDTVDDSNDNGDSNMNDAVQTIEKVLRKWQLKLGGKEHDDPWSNRDDLAFLFQRFRPNGEGIEEFCSDLNCAAIASRLLEMFRATADGYKNGNAVDAYFVVRKPPATSDEDLKALAEDYCQSLKHVAQFSEDELMESYFEETPEIEIRRGETAPLESSDIDISIYDALTFYAGRFKRPEATVLLSEALYTMANSFILANYVTWPITHDVSDADELDPYSKYFELWRRGVNPFFEDDHRLVLYTVS